MVPDYPFESSQLQNPAVGTSSGGSRNFGKGGTAEDNCVIPVVLYRKRAKRTICLGGLLKKNLIQWGIGRPTAPSLNPPLGTPMDATVVCRIGHTKGYRIYGLGFVSSFMGAETQSEVGGLTSGVDDE